MRRGNRMSSLPLTQYCQGAGVLNEVHGSGRAAAISTAFHAMQEGGKRANDLFARLHPEEQAELLTMKPPEAFSIDPETGEIGGGGQVLAYAEAEKELEVSMGSPPWTVGHLDMGWVAGTTAVVGDIKKTRWSSPDGPESLQMLAYGFAYAHLRDCKRFIAGHWDATEGGWSWGRVWDLNSLESAEAFERVRAAAMNIPPPEAERPEYAPGAHCRSCYGRFHCHEHTVPISNPESALACLSEPGGLTTESAAKALLAIQAIEDLVEVAKGTLKVYAERCGGIRDGKGKIYRLVPGKKPTESFDRKAFESDHPDLAQKYVRLGAPRSSFRWVNDK